MKDEQLLKQVAKHFKAEAAKFEDGMLHLKGSYCPNTDTYTEGWKKTIYTEAFVRKQN